MAATRGEADGPFTLLTPFPRREYATAAQLQTTLRQAQLVPRGTLLVLSERSRGVVHQAASAQSAQREQLQGHLAHLQQMLGELQAAHGPGLLRLNPDPDPDPDPDPNPNPDPNPDPGPNPGPNPDPGPNQAAQGPGEDAGYEQLLAWEQSMGGAVAAGLSATELRRLGLGLGLG